MSLKNTEYFFIPSDDKLLKTAVPEVKKLTKRNKEQIKEMKRILVKTNDAAAISANQLGIDDLKVFVCKNNGDILAIINPKITWTSLDNPEEIVQDQNGVLPKSVPMWESCLSFPGKNYLINRPFAIKVEYLTEKEVYKKVTLTDQWARLFCHEIDHLNGITLADKAEQEMEIDNTSPEFLPTDVIAE